jgi:TPP-dependent pyruvate/acetoin dehydrogenase alpha subunit
MYCRFSRQERYHGAMLLDMLEMTSFCRRASPECLQAMRQRAGAGGQSRSVGAEDQGLGMAVTIDIITSTHRVWLGTGGFAERPDSLY